MLRDVGQRRPIGADHHIREESVGGIWHVFSSSTRKREKSSFFLYEWLSDSRALYKAFRYVKRARQPILTRPVKFTFLFKTKRKNLCLQLDNSKRASFFLLNKTKRESVTRYTIPSIYSFDFCVHLCLLDGAQLGRGLRLIFTRHA